MKLYIYRNDTEYQECVGFFEGKDNQECEAIAETQGYSDSDNYHWSYCEPDFFVHDLSLFGDKEDE